MTKPTTTNTGIAVESDDESLSAGVQGPVVLHDHYLIEKLAQFNRERVPERIVHAKGSGAYGELVVTGDVSRYTKAKLFQPGARTQSLARFSTVAGEQGSPDTWRDPRGFAIKFYTEDGNYDLVGNNTPVFFIKDAMKFPDFIRSQKRLPGSGLRDHNMQWDFWTLRPESAHQVTWLMGDRGLPKTYRHMDGFGSHTYQWINAQGERFWVKYHFKTDQGIEFLTQAEADTLAGSDPDYHRKDLWEAIDRGDFPSWTVKVQIMPVADAETYRFNPFDLTKVWSQQDYPLIEVGTWTLNRNPGNFFVDIEQAAFEPSNIVPGIGFSPDKMLLGRVFAYADAHRYRIGTNYAQLPPNQAKAAEVNSYSKEGAMRYEYNPADVPVYAPNSFGGPHADPAVAGDGGLWEFDPAMVRAGYIEHAEDGDFTQAGTLVREVLDDAARQRLADNIVGHVLAGVTEPVLSRVFEYWRNVDADLGKAVEEGVRAGLEG
ncbi:catalase [Nocardia asteroides NBRC 15531]|uniref:Catalase n=1 Tax=Nocardia asteroides NBRC 15531 TaxID=1110697 RepID=U5EHY4_NOCAS|nr:catalase [Nocardia asteroides]TLF68804.1 catalase [Nocardia asteroides NBRC 15531]UGT48263.1 catalase [Nocardia asteroides]SFL53763.1 catalase [Nocardia asteroides]VEG32629.1 Catalase [Nocardia asteroides]GAD84749.1 catalase [Nocardia asteroides NBRC 15531]